MFCSQCATELSKSDVYCPVCSKPVGSFTSDGAQVEPLFETKTATVISPAKTPSRSRGWIFASIGGVVLILAIVGGLILAAVAVYVLFLMPTSGGPYQ